MSYLKGARTYADLIVMCKPVSLGGTCCACHRWGKPTWQLSTRASICEDCCKRKGDQVLGPIANAERKARRWIKNHPSLHAQPAFIASIAGVPLEFVQLEIERLATRKAVRS